jgi:glycosyltransferase involved in cell wall biosynthesis
MRVGYRNIGGQERSEKATMKIAVDAYYLAGRLRGMARFAQMLLQSLPEESRVALPARRGDGALAFITKDQKWFPLWEQCFLPSQARGAGADFLLCPYNTGPLWGASPPVIVAIHDLIFLDKDLRSSPSTVQNLGRLYRKLVGRRIAKKSHRIVTCSEYSKGQIVTQFGIDPEKIVVIPNVVGEEWFEGCPKPDLAKPYVLAVAGEAPSKNTRRLLEAMTLLHARMPELTLKIAGVSLRFHAGFAELANQHGLGSHVQLLPYLNDMELRETYRGASAFVCPSLAEGFGIPLLEAMASGIPVSSSNTTSLPEVAGDCAVYFDPLDPVAMAAAIETSLDRSADTKNRATAGRARATQFTLATVQGGITQFWLSL